MFEISRFRKRPTLYVMYLTQSLLLILILLLLFRYNLLVFSHSKIYFRFMIRL